MQRHWTLCGFALVPWLAAAACTTDDRRLVAGVGHDTTGGMGPAAGADADDASGAPGGPLGPGGHGGGHDETGRAGYSGADDTGFDASQLELASALDLNPDPDVVEVSIEAGLAEVDIGGVKHSLWTYNGTVPGPLIRAKPRDRLVVHFTNRLPEDTTIHWHGVRVPNLMDGTPMVQAPIKPNGTFEYEFELPDAGLYWFHPHLNTPEQVMRGLYAPILVEDPVEQEALAARDVVVVLSDISFDTQGAPDFASDDPLDLLNGREGALVLVNGREQPELSVPAGGRLRLRVLNAAGARYFQLKVPGLKLTHIGGDGGLAIAGREVDQVLLSNGERADLLLTALGQAGDVLTLQQVPYYRGAPLASEEPTTLVKLRLTAPTSKPPPDLPLRLRTIDPLPRAGATSVLLNFTVEGTTFKVNGVAGGEAPHLIAHVGETQYWRVKNETTFDHPFHVHGYFFQVLDSIEGKPQEPIQWKDTVNLPRGATLELLIRFDDRPGMWMHHCHILDHAELGFMQMLHVMP